MQLRRKPQEFDAVIYDGFNAKEVAAFAARHGCMIDADDRGLSINTAQGTMYVKRHYGLIASTRDEITVITPQQLKDDYERIDDAPEG